MRTSDPDQLASVAFTLNPNASERTQVLREPKLHRFAGPVIAAANFGSRLIAAVIVDGHLQLSVVGKPFADAAHVRVPVEDLPDDPLQQCDELRPVLFCGKMIVPIGKSYVLLSRDRCWTENLVHMTPTNKSDVPLTVRAIAATFFEFRFASYGFAHPTMSTDELHLVAGAGVLCIPAAQCDLSEPSFVGRWAVWSGKKPVVGPSVTDETALGVVRSDQFGLALVMLSDGGHLIRLDSLDRPGESKTLTAASGFVASVAVHPTKPVIAVQRVDGSMEIFHVDRPEPLVRLVNSSTPQAATRSTGVGS
jgi:hypothetical protein